MVVSMFFQHPAVNRFASRITPLAFMPLVLCSIANDARGQVLSQENPLRPAADQAILSEDALGPTSFEAPLVWEDGILEAEPACPDCGMAGGGNCRACGVSRCWGSLEYLMWWERGTELPTLVTTSPTGTAQNIAGVEGFDTTSVLFGNERVDDNPRDGFRITLGMWTKGGDCCGLGFQYFATDSRTVQFDANSGQVPILARPFFNVSLDQQDALLLGFPGTFAGNISINSTSETDGGGVFLRTLARTDCNYRFDWIVGYRYLAVDESLSIDDSFQFLVDVAGPAGITPQGTLISQSDLFDFKNSFHGFDIGLMGHSRDGRWMMDVWGKIALGNMHQEVTINGSTTTAFPNLAPTTVSGGLLTQNSNIGLYEADHFSIIPEATVNLGYEVSPHFDIWVGYTFLYVANVAQMTAGLDRQVNLTQQAGPAVGDPRPIYRIEDSDFWLQGINLGLNFIF